jgi:hypothetical protein
MSEVNCPTQPAHCSDRRSADRACAPNPAIVIRFQGYQTLTDSDDAAAVLVLADVQSASSAVDQGRGTLNPRDVAKQLGVSPATVIEWIRTRQLRASDIATGERPRYIIQQSDVDRFLKLRLVENN